MPRGTKKDVLPSAPGGVREDLHPAQIPDGAWRSGNNWLSRESVGVPRPGHTAVQTMASGDRIIGMAHRGTYQSSTNLIVHTLTKAYWYDGTTFNDKTGTWTASSAEQPVRFALLETAGGTTYIARVNAANAVGVWDGGAGNFVAAGGSPPAGLDITSSNGRLIVVGVGGDPNQVRVSDFNSTNFATAGAFNQFFLTDTPGSFIACRAFGPLTAALYKDDGLYVATGQAAQAPFSFQFIGHATGPVSPSSLVEADGIHYWIGQDGVVYGFDGSRPQAISRAISRTMLSTFGWDRRMEMHGVLFRGLPEPEIWWWYPLTATSSLNRCIVLNLATGAVSTHTFAQDVTASALGTSMGGITWDTLVPTTWTALAAMYPTWDSMTSAAQPTLVLGGPTGVVSQFGTSLTDLGIAIPWEHVTGWKATGGLGQCAYLDEVRSFWIRTTDPLTVTVGVSGTDTLDGTETEHVRTFDISQGGQLVAGYKPDNVRTEFYRVRHAGSSVVSNMHWRGGELLTWPRAKVP